MRLEKEKYANLEFLKDLWHFLRIYKGEFVFLTILLIASNALGLVPAIILAKIIDLFSSANVQLPSFYRYLLLLIGVGVGDTLLRHTGKYYFYLFTEKIRRNLKVECFGKVMQGDLVWHDKENTGNKIQRINEGDTSFGKFMDFYINKGVEIVVSITGVIIIFAILDLKYALIATGFIIAYLFFELRLNKRIAQRSLEIKIEKEKASGKVFEFSSNIATIKSLGMESASNKQIATQEEKVLEAKNARKKASTRKWVIVQTIAVIFYSLFIFFVGKDILVGVLTIGVIAIYIDYIKRLQNMLNNISSEATNLIDIKYGIFRMMKIYKSIPEIKERNAKNLENWKTLKIKNLSFKYKKEPVLDNINLQIKRGQKIGIVGGSGCGKSTLFKLLLKLYLPKKGNIFFDNRAIKNLTKDSILEKISVVPQETELFNLSLKDNVTISSPEKIDYNLYEKAIRISQLSEVISKLKDKDLTLIGEKGVRLSGGERQRLGIARAIYKRSEIIILDEATSNLDYGTEKKILEAFDRGLRDKTLIISAHRLTTLKNMDKIFFIEKGRIIEQGNYQELVNRQGKFYSLLKVRLNR